MHEMIYKLFNKEKHKYNEVHSETSNFEMIWKSEKY